MFKLRRNEPVSGQCPRCGTRLNGATKFCPECGATQRAATSGNTPDREDAATAHRSGTPYYAFVSVIVFALVFTAYGVSYHHQQGTTPGFTVQGPVLASMPPHHPLQGQSDERKGSTNSRARVARSLVRARASLAKNSLWPARRDITTALAEQPGNGEVLQMQAELVSREHERDSLIAYARLCVRDGQWTCARSNAAHALAVDASSHTARRLLSRAIAGHGSDSAESFDRSASRADGDQ